MPEAVAEIISYHERTKHHLDHYASGPHGLDWATNQTLSGASPITTIPAAINRSE